MLEKKMAAVMRKIVISSMILLILLPLLPLLISSLGHRWNFPRLLPEEISLRSWRYALSPTAGILEATGKTLLIALAVTALNILLGVPAAWALGRGPFPGKRLLEGLFFLPLLVPVFTVVMGFQHLFIRLNLADTILGVIIAHLLPTLPYMVLTASGVFGIAGGEYAEQARSLGSPPLRTFLRVTIPLAAPGIVTGSLFVFLISWSQYLLTLLIGGGRVLTLPVLLYSFAGAGDRSLTGALAVIFLLPVLIILLLTSRFLRGRAAAFGEGLRP